MATLAERLRVPLNKARAVAGHFGLRQHSVSIVSRVSAGDAWDGETAIAAEKVKPLVEADGQNPKVRWISQKEYMMGYPQDVTLEVKITAGLVATLEELDPEEAEVIFLVEGPGLGANGARFTRTSINCESALTWTFGLKRVGTSSGS